jgi:hypothetical protein
MTWLLGWDGRAGLDIAVTVYLILFAGFYAYIGYQGGYTPRVGARKRHHEISSVQLAHRSAHRLLFSRAVVSPDDLLLSTQTQRAVQTQTQEAVEKALVGGVGASRREGPQETGGAP